MVILSACKVKTNSSDNKFISKWEGGEDKSLIGPAGSCCLHQTSASMLSKLIAFNPLSYRHSLHQNQIFVQQPANERAGHWQSEGLITTCKSGSHNNLSVLRQIIWGPALLSVTRASRGLWPGFWLITEFNLTAWLKRCVASPRAFLRFKGDNLRIVKNWEVPQMSINLGLKLKPL